MKKDLKLVVLSVLALTLGVTYVNGGNADIYMTDPDNVLETGIEMEATPYSSCRVVFIDKFGIRWGIMTEQTER